MSSEKQRVRFEVRGAAEDKAKAVQFWLEEEDGNMVVRASSGTGAMKWSLLTMYPDRPAYLHSSIAEDLGFPRDGSHRMCIDGLNT